MEKKTLHRLLNIEILRGLAALAICLYHFCSVNNIGENSLSTATRFLYLGVDVFFVISGFVIPYSLYKKGYLFKDFFRFLKSRFARLYPALLISFIALVGLETFKNFIQPLEAFPSFSPKSILSNIFLICDLTDEIWYNNVAWTLALEAQYYLILALLFPLMIHKNIILSVVITSLWIVLPIITDIEGSVISWLSLFGVGIGCFMAYENKWPKWLCVFYLILAFSVTCYVRSYESCLAALFAVGFIFYLPNIKNKSLEFLGKISYSLYLFHIIVENNIMSLGGIIGGPPALIYVFLVAGIIISIIGSWIAYLVIEKPSHKWSRILWQKKTS